MKWRVTAEGFKAKLFRSHTAALRWVEHLVKVEGVTPSLEALARR
jgi:hypothetical protein